MASRPMALAAMLALALLSIGCPGSAGRGSETEVQQAAVPNKEPRTSANSAKAPATGAKSKQEFVFQPAFKGDFAWKHLVKQVSFGPRVPNTPGHRACRKYIEAELAKHCETVERQAFVVPARGEELKMWNVIGRFGMDKPRRIILAAHWDTRPTADCNPLGLRNRPIDGANDGASGVAVLLELARVFKAEPPDVGVDLVFFDGEDYGPGLEMMFLGAKHFAKKLSHSQVQSYNYGILLDMVGDRELDIHPEINSEAVATHVYSTAKIVADALGHDAFKSTGAYEIFDDHLPLIDRGIRMYDFIDFNYKPWHTTEDRVEKCSPASLEQVGQTVEGLVSHFPTIYEGPVK